MAKKREAKKPVKRTADENFSLILDLISEEGLSVREACKILGKDRREFYNLLKKDEEENGERRNQYARACEDRSDLIFEEILEIADDGTKDTITKKSKNGSEWTEEDKEWVNRSKLRVDARKWMLGKMQPKKYGDKVDVDLTSDGGRIEIKLDLGSSKDDEGEK